MSRTLPILSLALLAGCDNARLSGEVDGEGVGGAHDAFYDTLEIDLPIIGKHKYLTVMVTDFADGCSVFDDMFAAVDSDCDATCDNVVQSAEEHGLKGDQYWSNTFQVNASDSVNGDFDYDTDLASGHFVSSFSKWDAASFHDKDACVSACNDGTLFASDDTSGSQGQMTLEQQDGDDVISGTFDIDLDGGGHLAGGFAATHCDMGGWSIFD